MLAFRRCIEQGMRFTDQVFGHVYFHGLFRKLEHGDNLAHPVGAIVEKEDGVSILKRGQNHARSVGRSKCPPFILPASRFTMIGFKNSSVTSFSYLASMALITSGPSSPTPWTSPSMATLTLSHRLSRSMA